MKANNVDLHFWELSSREIVMTGKWISSNNSSNCLKVSDFRKWNLTYGLHKVKVLSQSIATSSNDLHYIKTESQLVA